MKTEHAVRTLWGLQIIIVTNAAQCVLFNEINDYLSLSIV